MGVTLWNASPSGMFHELHDWRGSELRLTTGGFSADFTCGSAVSGIGGANPRAMLFRLRQGAMTNL
jgi:hypothetical protein